MTSSTQLYYYLLRALVVLTATNGFGYQTWTISDAYFKYPTNTYVVLKNYLKTTIGPQIGFRVSFRPQYGIPLKEFFRTLNDTLQFDEDGLLRHQGKEFTMKEAFKMEKFLLLDDYYISVLPIKEVSYSPEDLYSTLR